MTHFKRKTFSLPLAGLLFCLLGAGCRPTSAPPTASAATVAAPPGVSAENCPQIDGSTSTMFLTQLLLSRICGLRGEVRRTLWPQVTAGDVYAGSDPLTSVSAQVVFPLDADDAALDRYRSLLLRRNRGTHEAYTALIEGRTGAMWLFGTCKWSFSTYGPPGDLILAAREPSSDELAVARKRGIELDVRPVARDAFIFLTHKDNPIKGLTLDQIRGIYTGKITNWKSLGGRDIAIRVFGRDRNSGSQELMERLVLQGRRSIATGTSVLHTMGGPIDHMANKPNGIAYTVYYYDRVMNRRANVTPLAVSGVTPTKETIASGAYPLTASVYVVTRKDLPADWPAAKVRDWLLSPEGQQLIADSGYVPL